MLVVSVDTSLKDNPKIEDFIGWKSEDGLLEVIELVGKQKHSTLYKVTCKVCSKDEELFPAGYFICRKSHLINNVKPCGCSKNPKWTKDQNFIRLHRTAKERGFIFLGFAEEYRGSKTKIDLKCPKDNHKWVSHVGCILSSNSGCPKCARNIKLTAEEALTVCNRVCKEMGYVPIGFITQYKNVKSQFRYICHKHGEQTVTYNNFIHNGTRCSGCIKDRKRLEGSGLYGWYPTRADEQDFLYVLNFNNQFIKVGRSFNIKNRILRLKSLSKINDITELHVVPATHAQIYKLEQYLLDELKHRDFQYNITWSRECFKKECLPILEDLLDNYHIEELI